MRTLAVAALVACLLWLPTSAAHAALAAATPAPHEPASAGLRLVELRFTEPVTRDFTSVAVTDAAGGSVATGPVAFDATSADTIRLPVRVLDDGTYAVTWRALTLDGHTATGAYSFQVGGGPPDPALVLGASASTPTRSLLTEGGLRAAFYVGLLGGVGLAFFALVIERRMVAPRGNVLLLAGIGMALGATAGMLELWMMMLRTGLAPLTILGTSSGLARGVRAAALYAGACVLVACSFALPARRVRLASAALVAGGVALIATALASHAAASSTASPLAIAADGAHLLMATIWVGGVVGLLVTSRDRAPGELGAGIARFTPWALGSVAVLSATGLFAASQRLPRATDLVTDPYGRLLLLKGVLILPLLGLGYLHKDKIGPALRRGVGGVRPFRRAVALEALVMVAVLLATGVLASSAPPAPPTVTQDLPPFVDHKDATWTTHVILRVRPNPLTVGPQQLSVVLHPLTIKDLPNDTRVDIQVARGTLGMPGPAFSLERTSPYEWTMPPTKLFNVQGTWRVYVHLMRPDEDRQLIFPLLVQAGP